MVILVLEKTRLIGGFPKMKTKPYKIKEFLDKYSWEIQNESLVNYLPSSSHIVEFLSKKYERRVIFYD